MKNIPKEVGKYYNEGSKRLLRIKANENYTLTLYYNDSIRIYDMSDKLYGVFECLNDLTKFYDAFIDEDGNIAWDRDNTIDSNIYWNNRIDICSDSAYIYSVEVCT